MNPSLTVAVSLYVAFDNFLRGGSKYNAVHAYHVFCMLVAKIYGKLT